MECDSCGTPVQDPQQDQQLMQYDRTFSQAMSHLTAGNWEQTIDLLRPLMSQYPTEKKGCISQCCGRLPRISGT